MRQKSLSDRSVGNDSGERRPEQGGSGSSGCTKTWGAGSPSIWMPGAEPRSAPALQRPRSRAATGATFSIEADFRLGNPPNPGRVNALRFTVRVIADGRSAQRRAFAECDARGRAAMEAVARSGILSGRREPERSPGLQPAGRAPSRQRIVPQRGITVTIGIRPGPAGSHAICISMRPGICEPESTAHSPPTIAPVITAGCRRARRWNRTRMCS